MKSKGKSYRVCAGVLATAVGVVSAPELVREHARAEESGIDERVRSETTEGDDGNEDQKLESGSW